jgi:predicted acyltransferase/predicted glycoside hydrolase/deacetylase ChbG (UPF0249 family)
MDLNAQARENRRSLECSRLASVDSLRGFALAIMLLYQPLSRFVESRPGFQAWSGVFAHADWQGFTLIDLGLPGFIFLSGVSLSWSLERRRLRGESRGLIARRLAIRAVALTIVGAALNAATGSNDDRCRWTGVLQVIAAADLLAGMLFLWAGPVIQAGVVVLALSAYGVALAFAGDGSGSAFSTEGKLSALVDGALLPGLKNHGDWDSEGIVQTSAAVAQAIFGLLVGTAFRSGWDPLLRMSIVLVASVLLLAAGYAIAPWCPMVKDLWTPSFGLAAMGYCGVVTAACYGAMDLAGLSLGTLPLQALGRRSLLVYIVFRSGVLERPFREQFAWSAPDWSPAARGAAAAAAALFVLCLASALFFGRDHRRIRWAMVQTCGAAVIVASYCLWRVDAAGESEKLVIFHADDAGLCESVNNAVIELMEQGRVRSASLMAPCSGFRKFAEYAASRPGLDFGVHLTLTSEWPKQRWAPVVGASRAPTLVDSDGCLWPSPKSVVKNARLQEVEAELRAQIDRVKAAGVHITHLDSHQFTLFRRPDFVGLYVQLGEEYDVPVLFPEQMSEEAVESTPELKDAWEAARRRLRRAGRPIVARLESRIYSVPAAMKEEYLRREIETTPRGLYVILFHPCEAAVGRWAPADAELRAADFRLLQSGQWEDQLRLIGGKPTCWGRLPDDDG